jgi:hypothetical protein
LESLFGSKVVDKDMEGLMGYFVGNGQKGSF